MLLSRPRCTFFRSTKMDMISRPGLLTRAGRLSPRVAGSGGTDAQGSTKGSNKGSDLMVAALENEGVDRIFGVPGEENLDVVEACAARQSSRSDPSRAGGGFHGGDPWAAHRQARRLHHDARPRRAQSTTGAAYALLGAMPMVMITGQKGILTAQQARLPDRRHRRRDEAADEDGASDRQRRDHSDHGARGVPRRAGGAAGPGSSRTAGRHRRRGAETIALDPAPSDRSADRAQRRARPRGRDDPQRETAADHARRRGKPAAALERCRASSGGRRFPFFNTQMGKGAVTGSSNLYMGTAALSRARLCPRGDRPRRSDRRDRPRHGREAAVPDGRRAGRR